MTDFGCEGGGREGVSYLVEEGLGRGIQGEVSQYSCALFYNIFMVNCLHFCSCKMPDVGG